MRGIGDELEEGCRKFPIVGVLRKVEHRLGVPIEYLEEVPGSPTGGAGYSVRLCVNRPDSYALCRRGIAGRLPRKQPPGEGRHRGLRR